MMNQPEHTKAEATRQLIVFRLAGQEYALPISQVREVVRTPAITPVPLLPPYLLGAANIRGQVLAVMDLYQRLRLPTHTHTQSFLLVLEVDNLHMGLLVDEVPNTLTVPESVIDQTPDILDTFALTKGYITGIARVQQRLIVLIDPYRLTSGEELKVT
jgi:purine-binding chemotaxis protein CheW